MSLQVWLPLNGNLNNLGLSLLTITNVGATISDNGKLGKCYSFNGTSSRIALSSKSFSYPLSMALWLKGDTITSTDTEYIFSYNTSTGGTAGHSIGIGTYNGKLSIWHNGVVTSYGTALTNNIWYHVAAIADSTSYKLYLNGLLVLSGTHSETKPDSTWLTIGCRSNSSTGGVGGGSYFFNGALNDVRLYDNILSDKEVKEISKGLVLHYPLQGLCGGNDNLLLDSKNERSVERTSGNTFIDYLFLSDLTSMTNTSWVFSFEGKASTTGMLCDFYFRNSDGSAYADTAYQALTTTYARYSLPFTGDPSLCKLCRFRANTGSGTIYIKNVKLEIGTVSTPWTPNIADMRIDSTKEIDVSGNGYHGTISGTLTTTSDTNRYFASTSFNGTNSYIVTTALNSNACKTISFWSKVESLPTDSRVIFADYGSLAAFGFWSGGFIVRCTSEGSSPVFPKGAYINNLWNHIVLLFDKTSPRLFINGNEISASTTLNNWTHNNTNLSIGVRSTGSYYNGKLSDFRIYSTTLSAEDIKELYQTTQSIDKNGNIYAYEYIEE